MIKSTLSKIKNDFEKECIVFIFVIDIKNKIENIHFVNRNSKTTDYTLTNEGKAIFKDMKKKGLLKKEHDLSAIYIARTQEQLNYIIDRFE